MREPMAMRNRSNHLSRCHVVARACLGRPGRRRRRGVTSMIAMLYLVLISTLAVGFYGMTTISAQVSKNDDAGARAYMAAQSGMDFMRRQMSKVHIPPNTPPESAIDAYYPNLQALLNSSANLGKQTIRR